MTAHIEVRNWERFQHYKKRNPPWIKLYTELLDDYELMELDPRLRWVAIAMLLLAGRTDNKIPAKLPALRNRLWMADLTPADVEKLASVGFIVLSQDASKVLARCYAQTETETETETTSTKSSAARVENSPVGEEADPAAEMRAFFAPLVREKLWRGKKPPPKAPPDWNLGRDLSIVRRDFLGNGWPPDRVAELIEWTAELRDAGGLPGVEIGEPMTMARLTYQSEWDPEQLYVKAERAHLAALEKQKPRPKTKPTGIHIELEQAQA